MKKKVPFGLITLGIILFVTSCNNNKATTPNLQSSTNELTPTTIVGYPPAMPGKLDNVYPAQDAPNKLKYEPDQIPYIPLTAPKPLLDKGSISGVLYSFTTHVVLADTLFYLIPAIGPEKNQLPPALFGPEIEKGDIVNKTNEKGQFYLADIQPGNYYFVVEAPMNWAVGLEEGKDSPPRLLSIQPNSENILGILFVSWP